MEINTVGVVEWGDRSIRDHRSRGIADRARVGNWRLHVVRNDNDAGSGRLHDGISAQPKR